MARTVTVPLVTGMLIRARKVPGDAPSKVFCRGIGGNGNRGQPRPDHRATGHIEIRELDVVLLPHRRLEMGN